MDFCIIFSFLFFLMVQEILFSYWVSSPRACGILDPGPGIKPVPPAVEAQSPNHWTTREVLF